MSLSLLLAEAKAILHREAGRRPSPPAAGGAAASSERQVPQPAESPPHLPTALLSEHLLCASTPAPREPSTCVLARAPGSARCSRSSPSPASPTQTGLLLAPPPGILYRSLTRLLHSRWDPGSLGAAHGLPCPPALPAPRPAPSTDFKLVNYSPFLEPQTAPSANGAFSLWDNPSRRAGAPVRGISASGRQEGSGVHGDVT